MIFRPWLALLATALIIAATGTVAPVAAHDFWIEPSSFHPSPGMVVGFGLRVGEHFIGDPVPRQSDAIERFFLRQGGDEQAITGADNLDPAGLLPVTAASTAVIGFLGGGSFIELPSERFTAYLHQYGLETIITARQQRGESNQPGRERFYRCAKALLTGAKADPALVATPLGFPLEIIPEGDPTAEAGRLRGHLLYQGQPVAGVRIDAYPQADPRQFLTTETDQQGAFSFILPSAGVWLLRSVHMVRAGFFDHQDWTSFWASLTFERRAMP